MMKKYLLGHTPSDIEALFHDIGEPRFRAKQLIDWLYNKFEGDFSKMTTLGEKLRARLAADSTPSRLELVKVVQSSDGQTQKFLWRLHDGLSVESVLIMAPGRKTVCVSTMVGCPARCSFCASGKGGLKRPLEKDEIVAQVWHIAQKLHEEGQERVSHVVFMGMGEPLLNYEPVISAARMLIDPALFGLSQRRVSISTVGVTEGIQRFSQEDLKINLVLSLHAPNQALRERIIPFARSYPLSEILEAYDAWSKISGRDQSFEYTLLSGINDGQEHARELASLLRLRQCSVNLIPYNPIDGVNFSRPEREAIERFRSILEREKIVTTLRYTKGDDIASACGQLSLEHHVSS